jgi:hypothetical protein
VRSRAGVFRAVLGLVGVALVMCFVSCSGSGGVAPDAGGAAGAPAGSTCQQIRECVFQTPCADAACVATCAGKGSAAAQTTFEALRACTAMVCAVNDVNCACGEQCFGDGACLTQVDACLAGIKADPICDTLCN